MTRETRKMAHKLHPCPYCACPMVAVERTAEGGAVVACGTCGMAGPESVDGDEEEAVKGWEILCGRLCSRCRTVYIKRILELRKRITALEGIQNERKA